MGTLMQECKRNKARIENVTNLIIIDMNKAGTKRISIIWYNSVIYCTLKGKKSTIQNQYDQVSRQAFDNILKRLAKNNIKLQKREILEFNAERFCLAKK